ncbi:zinc ABC transporter ATP-binding protein AztA [Streptomyces sp. MP131-18]|uniref:zinc ABC transporter ATP-binding protein AztA n=1 Tax=Streptomyces sp. MP131-18 TaxID=1857892 RepID=UPI00097BEB01|nr:zinc ABC transporter ATP-binding protein AztA [Streptomyces sp. MP131-18]ONK14603.1 putative siderophore transport system ATP-binding protein YusV [Streptomyces sp. MP131-18]
MNNAEPEGIAVCGVSAGYSRRTVLHDVTAHLPRSGVTSLVGPNGAGKSTLLAVLAGVLEPVSGAVEGRGPRRPAFVMQRSAVPDALPLTVREAVRMGRWADLGLWRRPKATDHALVEECMARLGVLDLAGRQLGSLSGGQRQRALVAQGLAQRPDLLLLDEPTAGLDREARGRIADVLGGAGQQGMTVIHATHDLDLALRSAHCLLLGNGRLVAQGPPAEVLTPEALRQVWNVPEPAHPGPPSPTGR